MIITSKYSTISGCHDSNLSKISQNYTLPANGWKTDSSILNDGYGKCNFGNTWNGYISGDPVGTIWTTFNGNGSGTLSFGNCSSGGNVKVFLNNNAIAEATGSQRKEVVFDYSVGDVLKIGEYNTAIWKLYSFSVQCR